MNKYATFFVITLIWAIIAVAGYFLARLFKDKLIIRCCVLLSVVCCYLLWMVTFLMQLNPLIGPRVEQNILYAMTAYWMQKEF